MRIWVGACPYEQHLASLGPVCLHSKPGEAATLSPRHLHVSQTGRPAHYLIGVYAAVDGPRGLEVLEHALLEWPRQAVHADEVLEVLHATVVQRAARVHALDDGRHVAEYHRVHQSCRVAAGSWLGVATCSQTPPALDSCLWVPGEGQESQWAPACLPGARCWLRARNGG